MEQAGGLPVVVGERVALTSAALRSEVQPRRPLLALALLAPGLEPEVRAASGDFALELECLSRLDVFVNRVESHCPPLLLVDADLVGGCPADLCRFARSLRPDVKILSLAWCWSDRDDALRGCADGVLRKPPRRAAWSAVLAGLGLPRA